MPFETKVESENLLKQFDDMQKRVLELDQKLPTVFLDWQRDDMHRKYPKVDEQNNLSVTTLVYPRSRRKRVSTGGKKGTGTTRKPARRVKGAARPILRPELVEQLFDRMAEMCRESIEWQ